MWIHASQSRLRVRADGVAACAAGKRKHEWIGNRRLDLQLRGLLLGSALGRDLVDAEWDAFRNTPGELLVRCEPESGGVAQNRDPDPSVVGGWKPGGNGHHHAERHVS